MEIIAADTDIVIDFLRGKGPYVQEFYNLLRKGHIGFVVVSVFELLIGAATVKKEREVGVLIGRAAIFDIDFQASQAAAAIFKKLRDNGETMGMADSLIAGVCIARDIRLMTKNLRHFQNVPHLRMWEPPRP